MNPIFEPYFSEEKPSQFYSLEEEEINSMKIFFSDKASNYYKYSYIVGEEEIKVYGNTLNMKVHCTYFNSLDTVNDDKENIRILPNFKISMFPIQFILLWSHINGISKTSYYISDISTFDEIFNLIDLSNWLGFDLFTATENTIQEEIEDLMYAWTHITAKNMYWIHKVLDLSYKLYIIGYEGIANKLKETTSIILNSGIKFEKEKDDEKKEK